MPPQFLHQWLDFLCISEASEEDKIYLITSFAKSLSDEARKRRDAFEFVYTLAVHCNADGSELGAVTVIAFFTTILLSVRFDLQLICRN